MVTLGKYLSSLALLVMSVSAVRAATADQHTVLITGANRGIGLEFVKQYAELGWNVIATCRNPEQSDELNAFAAQHEDVVVERLDVLDHAGIDALAARYRNQPIDILLNNAGLMRGPDPEQTVGTIDYQEFELFFRTNAMGPLKVSEAFYPNVVASEFKTMAALTTGKGKRGIPVPGFSLYKSSKAALDSIQQEIAIRWRSDGVKVITLMPGRVLTHGERGNAGQRGIVDIKDSIRGMISVLEDLTLIQSGRTITWNGEIIE